MRGPPRTMARLVVIQATPFCNVDCCCYLPDRSSPKCIDHQNLERTLDVPLLERIERLRERMKWEGVNELRLTSSDEDEGGDGDGDWSKW